MLTHSHSHRHTHSSRLLSKRRSVAQRARAVQRPAWRWQGTSVALLALLALLATSTFFARPQEAVAALAHVAILAPSAVRLALLCSGPMGAAVAQLETAANAYQTFMTPAAPVAAQAPGAYAALAPPPLPQDLGMAGVFTAGALALSSRFAMR